MHVRAHGGIQRPSTSTIATIRILSIYAHTVRVRPCASDTHTACMVRAYRAARARPRDSTLREERKMQRQVSATDESLAHTYSRHLGAYRPDDLTCLAFKGPSRRYKRKVMVRNAYCILTQRPSSSAARLAGPSTTRRTRAATVPCGSRLAPSDQPRFHRESDRTSIVIAASRA